jgi:hypothetical protein
MNPDLATETTIQAINKSLNLTSSYLWYRNFSSMLSQHYGENEDGVIADSCLT